MFLLKRRTYEIIIRTEAKDLGHSIQVYNYNYQPWHNNQGMEGKEEEDSLSYFKKETMFQ